MMKLNILILIGVIILISGCTPSGTVQRIASAEGVDVSFIAGSPPDVISDDSSFVVAIKLENGADIRVNGRLCARGILMDYGGFVEEQCKDFNLEGVQLMADSKKIEKDWDIAYFNSGGYKTKERTILEPTFVAKATYGCEFIAGPQLCATSNLFIKDIETQCAQKETISGSKLYSKSAPITLTKVDKELSKPGEGNEVRMDVTLLLKKANDGGYVVNSLDDAETGNGYVKVGVSFGSYGDMKCNQIKSGGLEWKRKENEKVIKCEILLDNVGPLVSAPLNVNLKYYYRVDKQKMIKVEKTITDDSDFVS